MEASLYCLQLFAAIELFGKRRCTNCFNIARFPVVFPALGNMVLERGSLKTGATARLQAFKRLSGAFLFLKYPNNFKIWSSSV